MILDTDFINQPNDIKLYLLLKEYLSMNGVQIGTSCVEEYNNMHIIIIRHRYCELDTEAILEDYIKNGTEPNYRHEILSINYNNTNFNYYKVIRLILDNLYTLFDYNNKLIMELMNARDNYGYRILVNCDKTKEIFNKYTKNSDNFVSMCKNLCKVFDGEINDSTFLHLIILMIEKLFKRRIYSREKVQGCDIYNYKFVYYKDDLYDVCYNSANSIESFYNTLVHFYSIKNLIMYDEIIHSIDIIGYLSSDKERFYIDDQNVFEHFLVTNDNDRKNSGKVYTMRIKSYDDKQCNIDIRITDYKYKNSGEYNVEVCYSDIGYKSSDFYEDVNNIANQIKELIYFYDDLIQDNYIEKRDK